MPGLTVVRAGGCEAAEFDEAVDRTVEVGQVRAFIVRDVVEDYRDRWSVTVYVAAHESVRRAGDIAYGLLMSRLGKAELVEVTGPLGFSSFNTTMTKGFRPEPWLAPA